MQPKSLLYLLVLLRFILPFFLQHPFYQPHRDEFLYLVQGQHLAWGYLEVPPLLSIFAWVVNALGAGMFWIKFFPSLFAALTYLLMGKIVLRLGGRHFALILAFLPLMVQGYLRLFFLFQPNFLEVFFWTAMAYCLFRYIDTRSHRWMYAFGIAAGLGILSKYSAAFYIAALMAGMLLSRHRGIFGNKHLYLAALVAFVMIAPNLYWQYAHNIPLLKHMEELKATQLQFISPKDFLLSQVLMNLPCIFVVVAAIAFTTINQKGRAYLPFTLAFVCVLVILLLMHGKDYYAMGAYPVLYALGAYQLESATRTRFRLTRFVMLTYSLALGLFLLPLLMPMFKPDKLAGYYETTGINKSGAFKWEDLQYHPLPQDFADMIGWREIATKAAKVYHSLPESEQKQTLVYTRGYFTAGALNYYRHQLKLPVVHSDNASFLLWMPDDFNIRNLILVGHNVPEKDDLVFQQFAQSAVVDSLNYPLARENGMKIILFRHGNDKVNGMISQGIKEMKAEFNHRSY